MAALVAVGLGAAAVGFDGFPVGIAIGDLEVEGARGARLGGADAGNGGGSECGNSSGLGGGGF